MHEIYNPINLLGKELEISYHVDDLGEDATVVELDSVDGERRFEIVFKKYPETEDDERFFWTTQEPYEIVGDKAAFANMGYMRRIYLQIKKLDYTEEVTSEQTKNDMKTTVKELSDKLGIDVVYVNGFIQTLVKIGKAEVVGKVEKPAGARGKPSNIYQIAEGIL
jgi:hypothetical protein